jgi:uncharacterized protein involved in response to NO
MSTIRPGGRLLHVVNPAAPPPPTLEPYRVLFPIGIASGLIATGVWPLALVRGDYPAVVHRGVMMLGFEMSFVLGFLLTAMPAFTRGEKCRPWELGIAALAQLVYLAGALSGADAVAQAATLAAVLLVSMALVRRVAVTRALPPEEFAFVAFALVAGITGAALRLAAALGAPIALAPRFTERLTSLGMVLPLVLGLGSLLVPTFAGMRDPLVIPLIAGAHERPGRRGLYALLMLALAASFAADLAGRVTLAAWLRAGVAWVMVVLVWKLYRRPGLTGAPANALWLSGWMVALGLFGAALAPTHATALLHVVFIGGFSLLTLGIGTRVLVSHGHHPLELERAALTPWVLSGLAFALSARLVAEWAPASAPAWLAASGAAWWLAWGSWGVRAIPGLWSTGHR